MLFPRIVYTIRLLSGEYRYLALVNYVDIYVGDPLCPPVLIVDPQKLMYIPLPLSQIYLVRYSGNYIHEPIR